MTDGTANTDDAFPPIDQAAVTHHEVFLGYLRAGFTEQQALYLLGCIINGATRGLTNG